MQQDQKHRGCDAEQEGESAVQGPENEEAYGKHCSQAGSRVAATAAAHSCTGFSSLHHYQCTQEGVQWTNIPGQSETDAEAEKVIGLVVEEIVDDAVTPSLWIAWIWSRQARSGGSRTSDILQVQYMVFYKGLEYSWSRVLASVREREPWNHSPVDTEAGLCTYFQATRWH